MSFDPCAPGAPALAVALYFGDDAPELLQRLEALACPRCGVLGCDDGELCDLLPEELEEHEAERRACSGSDATLADVGWMRRGWEPVEFVAHLPGEEPIELEPWPGLLWPEEAP